MELRQMRRIDRAMSREEIEAFLREMNVGHLGTVNAHGYPYVVPLNYVYDQGRFIFHSALVGEKLENIRSNPKVCFEVAAHSEIIEGQKACNFTIRYKSAIAYGKASVVEGEEKLGLLRKFAEVLTGRAGEDLGEKEARTVSVIVMEVEAVTGKKRV